MYKQQLYIRIKRPRLNHQIREPQIRLIDQNGKQVGIVPTHQALIMAHKLNLDLVEVAGKIRPPVCRIMDFGKYQYKQTKKLRKQKAKSKKGELKGIRLRIATAQHDLELKAKRAQKFLDKGHRVKIELVLHGRQKSQTNLARETIQKFLDLLLKDTIKITQPIKHSPRGMNVIIDKT